MSVELLLAAVAVVARLARHSQQMLRDVSDNYDLVVDSQWACPWNLLFANAHSR